MYLIENLLMQQIDLKQSLEKESTEVLVKLSTLSSSTLMIQLLEVETSTEHILEAHTIHNEMTESEKSESQILVFQSEQSLLLHT